MQVSLLNIILWKTYVFVHQKVSKLVIFSCITLAIFVYQWNYFSCNSCPNDLTWCQVVVFTVTQWQDNGFIKSHSISQQKKPKKVANNKEFRSSANNTRNSSSCCCRRSCLNLLCHLPTNLGLSPSNIYCRRRPNAATHAIRGYIHSKPAALLPSFSFGVLGYSQRRAYAEGSTSSAPTFKYISSSLDATSRRLISPHVWGWKG